MLFSGSVADNIAKGRPSLGEFHLLTLEEVAAQAKALKSSGGSLKTGGSSKKSSSNRYRSVAGGVADIESGAGGEEEHVADEDVINACIASNAHEFIKSFPQVLLCYWFLTAY